MADDEREPALLIELLTHEACGGMLIFVSHERTMCTCVTSEAVKAREDPRTHQAWELYQLVAKLREIEKAEQPLRIENGELSTPCACCNYRTWNDVTFLQDAYEAAGFER